MVTKKELEQAFDVIGKFAKENELLSRREMAELALLKKMACSLCENDSEDAQEG